jgi:hypothetical protein
MIICCIISCVTIIILYAIQQSTDPKVRAQRLLERQLKEFEKEEIDVKKAKHKPTCEMLGCLYSEWEPVFLGMIHRTIVDKTRHCMYCGKKQYTRFERKPDGTLIQCTAIVSDDGKEPDVEETALPKDETLKLLEMIEFDNQQLTNHQLRKPAK